MTKRIAGLTGKRRRVARVFRTSFVLIISTVILLSAVVQDSNFGSIVIFLLLCGLPLAILWTKESFKTHPNSILLLRPFSEPQISLSLARLVHEELSFLGYTYTLADNQFGPAARSDAILGAIFRMGGPLLAWLAPDALEVGTRDGLARLAGITQSPRRLAWRWLISRRRLLVIKCDDRFWRDVITYLMNVTDYTIAEISEIGPGSVWEIERLQRLSSSRVLFIATESSYGEARKTVGAFFPGQLEYLFAYRSDGSLTKKQGFLEVFERRFCD